MMKHGGRLAGGDDEGAGIGQVNCALDSERGSV